MGCDVYVVTARVSYIVKDAAFDRIVNEVVEKGRDEETELFQQIRSRARFRVRTQLKGRVNRIVGGVAVLSLWRSCRTSNASVAYANSLVYQGQLCQETA